jgi:uncharacterized protein
MAVTDALITQRREIESRLKERYIERDAEISRKSGNLIRVISGPRRAGKSFFAMHQLPPDGKFGYVNFDDERLAAREGDEIIAAVKEVFGAPEVLFLDEIQNLPNWELFVNRLQREGYRLLLTGSNSQLLSSELATHLTGRYIQITLFPFSFKEVLRTRGELVTTMEKQAMLAQYVKNGGFPEVILKDIGGKEYLSTLFDAIVYKDIVKRYRIRSIPAIEDLAMYLVSNVASEYSYTTLAKITRSRSVHTVKKYLGYLEQTFLFFSVPRFSFKVKEQITANRKCYCIDNGFIQAKAANFSENRGRLYENLVAISLKRHEMNGALTCYTWKNVQQEEVDFVIQKENRIAELIQVCMDITSPATKDREIRALIKAGHELRCNQLRVLTETEERVAEEDWFGNTGTIIYEPLWKWLERDSPGDNKTSE